MCVGIAALRESLGDYAGGFDAAVLSAAQAQEVVDQAARIENIAATVVGLAAARVAECGSWRAQGERSAAHQLARRSGTTVVAAAAAIDTARGLGALPETSAAARRGELSAEQAFAIVDAAGAHADAEHDLLEAARRSPLSELRQHCARAKASARLDVEERRRRIHQRRSLRSYTDAEGEWHLHCRNNPEVGARIMAALDSFREAIFRHARSESRPEPPDAYAADALTEMARQSLAAGPGVGEVATGTGALKVAAGRQRTRAGDVRRAGGHRGTRDEAEGPDAPPGDGTGAADGVGAETSARAGDHGADAAHAAGPKSSVWADDHQAVGTDGARAETPVRAEDYGTDAHEGAAAEHPQPTLVLARRVGPPKIIVRVDLESLLRGFPSEGEVCEIAGFGPVAVSAVRDMIDSDDPFLAAVATRGQRLVGVAHLGRRPNALQQTALQWLYPSCANEACSARARLDYDHRLDWASTHVTVLDLLDRLCQHCHALKTRKNWSLVEGRGQRALVPPDDRRHPRNATANAVDPRVNGPPGQ